MRKYLRLLVFFAVVVVILVVVNMVRQTTAPESVIIARERDKMQDSQDKKRLEGDPLYARQFQDRIHFLEYRLAIAYNAENRPDEAIAVLQRLIGDEEAHRETANLRLSQSYLNEAEYYEVLKESYDIKHDEGKAQKAAKSREDLLTRAAELREREGREEGKSVGLRGE